MEEPTNPLPPCRYYCRYLQLIFECGDLLVRITVADSAQTGRLLAQLHTGVFRATNTNTNNRWLAGKSALAKGNQRIEQEPLDAIYAITGEQHTVISAKQPPLCTVVISSSLRQAQSSSPLPVH